MRWHTQHLTYVVLIVEVRHHHRHRHSHFRCLHEMVLIPRRRNIMSNVTVNVGHNVSFSLLFLDQQGNPMLVTPTPDAPPVWSDTTAATGTLTAAANGLTASEVALAAGTDTVNVSLMVGGVVFPGSIDVTVQAVPQILTSIAILASVA